MRWTTIGIAALGAAVLAWINGPLFDVGTHGGSTLSLEIGFAWSAATVIAPMFIVVVGSVLGMFRALWLSTRRAELAAQIALGRPRRSLVGGHVRAGLRDGLIAAGGGTLVAGLVHQAITGIDRVSLMPSAFLNYCSVVLWLTASFVLAYWVAALWATRGSVREVASGHRADARAESSVRGKHRLGRLGWVWTVSSLVVVASVVVSLGPWQMEPIDGTSGLQSMVAFVAATIVALVIYLAVPGLLAVAGAKVAGWLSRVVGRALARSTVPGSVRSLAADGLARPAPLRTAAAAAVIAVMGVATVWSTLVYAQVDTSSTAQNMLPKGAVSTIDVRASDDTLKQLSSGWAEPLPRELVDRFHADPALIVVEAGVLVSDLRTVYWQGHHVGAESVRDLLLAVHPQDLDAVSPSAWKRLYLVDGVQWQDGLLGRAGGSMDGSDDVIVDGERTSMTGLPIASPWAGISRTWAEGIWEPIPTSAVLLYPAGEVRVTEALEEYDLTGLSVVNSDATFGWPASVSDAMVAVFTAPFLAVAVAIVIVLAWSGQRLRARDQATLLALGATPSALRGAAALEAGVLTTIAGAVGLAGGALIGPLLSTLNQAPVSQAGLDLLLWNMGQDFAALPWGVLSALVVVATVVAAAGALLVRVRLDRLTPAQQLTEAQKAGIS